MPWDIESVIESIDILGQELKDIRRQSKTEQFKSKVNETVRTPHDDLLSHTSLLSVRLRPHRVNTLQRASN